MVTGCPRLKTWTVALPRYQLLIRARKSRTMAPWPSPLTNFPQKCQKNAPQTSRNSPKNTLHTAYWYEQWPHGLHNRINIPQNTPPNAQKSPKKLRYRLLIWARRSRAVAPWPSPSTKYPPKTPEKCPKIAQKITLPPIDMGKKIKGNGAMAFIID